MVAGGGKEVSEIGGDGAGLFLVDIGDALGVGRFVEDQDGIVLLVVEEADDVEFDLGYATEGMKGNEVVDGTAEGENAGASKPSRT